MTGAGLTGGTASGYAGQPSGRVSGNDLSSDPRDRDRDGFVADDKIRDATHSAGRGAREIGRDIKEGAESAGRKISNAAHEMKEDVKDLGNEIANMIAGTVHLRPEMQRISNPRGPQPIAR